MNPSPDITPDSLSETARWFQIAKPSPTDQNLTVQFGVHCEEVAETLGAIAPLGLEARMLFADAFAAMNALAFYLKANPDAIVYDDLLRKELLDGLCDNIVTAVGVGHCAGLDVPGAMTEINRSNFSKFEEGKPVLGPTGKIMKGKDYRPPQLDIFIL